MAHYRKIDCRIWNDEKFLALSDNGKLVWLFLLTHPNLTPLGAMRASIPGLAAELRLDGVPNGVPNGVQDGVSDAFQNAFRESLQKGMLRHDEIACCLWIPHFLRYNPPQSENVVKSWLKFVDLIPECEVKWQCLLSVKAFLKAFPKAYQDAFPYAVPNAVKNPSLIREHRAQIGESEKELSSLPKTKRGLSRKPKIGHSRKLTLPELPESARNLALQLKTSILENNPDAKITDSQLVKWTRDADRMFRRDNRNPQDASELLAWSQHDPFWLSNILSISKFRQQYDRLTLQAQANPQKPPRSQLPHPPAPVASGHAPLCAQCGTIREWHAPNGSGHSLAQDRFQCEQFQDQGIFPR